MLNLNLESVLFVLLNDLTTMIMTVRIMKTSQITMRFPVISDFILSYLDSRKNQGNVHIKNGSAGIDVCLYRDPLFFFLTGDFGSTL